MGQVQIVLAPLKCSDKLRLIHQIRNVIAEIMWTQIAELDAVVIGDPSGTEQFSIQIQKALDRKNALLGMFKQHLLEHGCWGSPETE